ncbi:MAG: extracellular solute-binding protein [Rhodobacteraceae bacterium]|nr:extracellular solute-binding protein [Paracoccaceae bacterium]
MHDKRFLRETLVDGARAYKEGRMDRRRFLVLCGMAGFVTPAVLAGRADAAANQVIMWNWGGLSEVCHGRAIGEPFTAATGIPVGFDTSGPLQGKIREMVESGAVTADVADGDLFDAVSLGNSGHLEPIDYDIVRADRTVDGYALEYGIAVILYGYAFVYDTHAYPDNPPDSWADFFDTGRFPGRRTLYRWANGSIEAALIADGVPRDELYPLDLPRALAKVASIKDDTIFWSAASEAHSMIVNGEVSMGMIWQNRGRSMEEDTDGRYKMVMNDAFVYPGGYTVPRGNPAGREAAMRFIATAQEMASQLELFDCLGMTPANPEAFDAVPEDDQPYAITSAMNIDKVIFNDPVWWGNNIDEAVNRFLETIS